MFKHILSISIIFLLTACEGMFFNKKVPLEGERISIKTTNKIELFPDLENPASSITSINNKIANGLFYNYQNSSLGAQEFSEFKKFTSVKSNRLINFNALPIILTDKFIIMNAVGEIYAYDMEGKELWRNKNFSHNNRGFFSYGNKYFSGGMLFADGVIYAVAGTNQVIAINATDGNLIWHSKVNGVLRTNPVVNSAVVLVQSVDNKVFALDINSGDEIWSNFTAPTETTTITAAPAVVAGDSFFVQYNSGELVNIASKTGKVIWEADNSLSLALLLSQDTSVGGSMNMVKSNDLIYLIDKDNTLHAINIADGKIKWSLKINAVKGLWLAGNYIYTIDAFDNVYAIHKTLGKAKWQIQLNNFITEKNKDKQIFWTSPVVINNKLVVMNSLGQWFEFNVNDGSLYRELKIDGSVSLPPIVANNKVFVIANNGKVYIS